MNTEKIESASVYNKIIFKISFVIVLLAGIYPLANVSSENLNRKELFDEGWKFCLGDYPEAIANEYNDRKWRFVDLPHDWSIEEKAFLENPSGNDGGYFPTGIGWYRKVFDLPSAYEGKIVNLYFEGVYMNAEVFINGHSLGTHPYGYSPFYHNLTPYLNYNGRNVLAVRVDNSRQKNCRWYSGSGIYRHVWLLTTDRIHADVWGVAINTSDICEKKASVQIKSLLRNETDMPKRITLTTQLMQNNCNIGEEEETIIEIPANKAKEVILVLSVTEPVLWSPDTPYLYNACLTLKDENGILDTLNETFGIRSIEYNDQEGFLLNGKNILLNGGCLHHDNGCLGAAAYDRAEERKAELMKGAGFNAVRTAHNIPSEAFLHACDRIGLLVIDEAFDGWREAKNTHDYSIFFDQWWQRDIESMVLRDRNHPSVFCWSIGNEVIERKKLEVVTTARKLADYVHQLDPTRPVTSALTTWDKEWEIFDPLAAVHDIVGYNYQLHRAASDHERVPSRIIMQTESYPRDAFANWERVNDNNYIIGDFVWTAMDYLGESGIGRYYYDGETTGEHYDHDQYPYHGAYCGDIDLTGWRKPVSHYRDMLYNPDKKLYMAVKEPNHYHGTIRETLWSVWPTWESWNWPGHEGKEIEVEIYSGYSKVQLYLNDKLIGEQTIGRDNQFKAVFSLLYEPGILKAVGMDDFKTDSVTLATAGKVAGLKLSADRKKIKADGQDLAFITIEMIDENGILVPNAENYLSFTAKGAGKIIATGNANLKDSVSYKSHERNAWKGRALVVLKSANKSGKITLKVTSPGLRSSSMTIYAEH